MTLSAEEIAQAASFGAAYVQGQTPVMQAITDAICCCGHIGTSWTTVAEADMTAERLGLDPNTHLLELGAGAGWPGLQLAQQSGCRVTLVDLPEQGLRIARERAAADGIASKVKTFSADAGDLPFDDGAFTAINHSDLLCCLRGKRRVLAESRRVLAPGGRMAFTVIAVAPGLSDADTETAIETGPPFIAAEEGYDAMLAATGWREVEHIDLTPEYERACARAQTADETHAESLRALIGAEEATQRRDKWVRKLAAIRRRLVLRHFYLVEPL